jgi:hypothetical protein
LPRTLQQLTSLLQRTASSGATSWPSPLLDVYPTLLSEQVPAQLCRLLVSASAGAHASAGVEYSALLPLVLQAFVAMLQPTGGRVAPMPLDGLPDDATTSVAAVAAAGGGAGAAGGVRASLRATAGRAPPNLELQLRRQLADCICTMIPSGEGGSSNSAFELISRATLPACRETGAALAKRGEPPAALSSLVIVLCQTTRACVATPAPSTASTAANPAGSPIAGGSSSPVNAVPVGGLLDCLARDLPLLTSLWSSLQACAAGLLDDGAAEGATSVSARARLTGRLLLFFASLCGKHPGAVRLLVQQGGLDLSVVATWIRPNAAPMLALPAAFLLAQLLTNPHARLEALLANPLPLLHSVAHWLSAPASVPSFTSSTGLSGSTVTAAMAPTLLVELEGSGVGYSLLGSHDGLLQLLQAVLYLHAVQASALSPSSSSTSAGSSSTSSAPSLISREALPASEDMLTGRIWQLLLQRLERLDQPAASNVATVTSSSAGELSVLGWMSFLSLMLDLLKLHARVTASRAAAGGRSAEGVSDTLLTDSLFRGVCALLSAPRVAALFAWPEACGGGPVGVWLLLKRALALLYVPFTFRSVREELLARAQKCLFNLGFVRRLLSAARLLELPSQLEAPVGFLAHLVMRHAKFEEQLVEAGGLILMANKGVLNPAPRTAMLPAPPGTPVTSPGGAPPLLRVQVAPSVALLTNALNIVSHLARSSAAHYAAIHTAGLYTNLRALLKHPDAAVRAKTCNVLGNLCRHSAFFYPHLLSAGLIPPLVARCGEREPQVRKWAAFALGNAVFHDASLAAQVAKAIPVLLKLLRPESDGGRGGDEGKNAAAAGSDRTAQNAAGVLTNLLRHGGLAAHEMIEQGAVGTLCALLEEACVAASSSRISPAQQQQQVQCARSALFTLGDLAAFRAARRELQQAGALERIQQLQQDSSDPKLHTYWQRLLTRYNAPPQG